MKTTVYNKNLEAVEEMDLNPKIFEVKPEVGLVAQAVRVQMANSRKSIAHTKTRGDVRGGGRKPWKQKGTGNARAGSIRSPLWRHGGVAFGPRSNRNFALKMNQKEWRKALYMVLSDKAANKNFLIFKELEVFVPKTKEMAIMLKNLGDKIATGSKKFLFVLPGKNENLERAARNLKGAKVIRANSLNVKDVVDYDLIITPVESIKIIESTYLK